MDKKVNGLKRVYGFGLLVFALFLGVFLLQPSPDTSAAGPLQQPTPTCAQPDDVDIAFAFCDAAHDDIADEYPSLYDVGTDGFIPPVILKAIGWYETHVSPIGGWAQCVNGSPYSSPSGCDWGIMQINTGMDCVTPTLQFDSETQQHVKYDYRYNIGMGAFILKKWKWDWHQGAGRIIGDGSPYIAEHWYYAVWAYNEWTWENNPNNTDAFPCNNWPYSASNCVYQDRIWWRAAHPPTRNGLILWSPVNLTRPDRSLLPDESEWASWPSFDWAIDDPLPVHQDWCRACLPAVLKNHCTPHYGEQLTNGNFNIGDTTGWSASRSNCADAIVQPYGGSEYAASLGRCNSNSDQLYQTICIPSQVSSAWLQYQWWIASEETTQSQVYDSLHIRIRDASGGSPVTLETLTNLSPKGNWYSSQFNLSAYAGQTIQVSFEAANDYLLPTHFWIENVSLNVTQ